MDTREENNKRDTENKTPDTKAGSEQRKTFLVQIATYWTSGRSVVEVIVNGLNDYSGFFELILTGVAIWYGIKVFTETKDQVKIAKDALIQADSVFKYQKTQDSVRNFADSVNDVKRDTVNAQNLRIAQNSLDLTRKSLELAKSNSQADLRAYLVIDDVTISDVVVGKIPKISYSLKNLGKTPAYKVNVSASLKIGTGIYPHEWNELRTEVPDTGFFIASGTPRGFDEYFPRPLVVDDSISIGLGKQHLYFAIYVTYRDKFHNLQFIQQGSVYVLWKKDMIGLRQYEGAS